MFHGVGHSSENCQFLSDFGKNYLAPSLKKEESVHILKKINSMVLKYNIDKN